MKSNSIPVWLLYWDFLTFSLAFNPYNSCLDYSIKEEKKNKQKITNQKFRAIFKLKLFVLVLHQWIRSFLTTVLSQLTLSKKQQWHTELFQVWFDAKEKVKVILFQNAKNMFDTEKKCGCDFRCVGLSKTAKNNLTIFNGKKSFYFDRMFSSICII